MQKFRGLSALRWHDYIFNGQILKTTKPSMAKSPDHFGKHMSSGTPSIRKAAVADCMNVIRLEKNYMGKTFNTYDYCNYLESDCCYVSEQNSKIVGFAVSKIIDSGKTLAPKVIKTSKNFRKHFTLDSFFQQLVKKITEKNKDISRISLTLFKDDDFFKIPVVKALGKEALRRNVLLYKYDSERLNVSFKMDHPFPHMEPLYNERLYEALFENLNVQGNFLTSKRLIVSGTAYDLKEYNGMDILSERPIVSINPKVLQYPWSFEPINSGVLSISNPHYSPGNIKESHLIQLFGNHCGHPEMATHFNYHLHHIKASRTIGHCMIATDLDIANRKYWNEFENQKMKRRMGALTEDNINDIMESFGLQFLEPTRLHVIDIYIDDLKRYWKIVS